VGALLGAETADSATLTRLAVTTLLSCRSARVVVPIQDLLCQGTEARMNVPGIAEGNWSYRMTPSDITTLQAMSGELHAMLAQAGLIKE